MNGPKVWDFAVDTVPRVVRSLLAEHDLTPSDLDLIVLHQSNLRMLEAIMASLELPMEQTVTTVETYGNTAAASIPLTLEKASEAGKLRAGFAGHAVRIRRRSLVGRGAPRLVTSCERTVMHSVLITGAGSGIGAGLATELARAGDHVLVSDLNLDGAEAVVGRIRATGGSAELVPLDVTSEKSVTTAVASLSRPVDVLINNAGLQFVAPLEEFPLAQWEHLIHVMLTGAVALTRAVLPGMRARGFGRIINMGSIHSLVASPFKSAYVAAKHALVGFSKVIALETANTDITINTLCPSYVKTPLVDRQIADQARIRGMPESEVISQIMLKPMPKGVFIGIDELAGVTRLSRLRGGAEHHRTDDRHRRRLDRAIEQRP